MTTQRDPARPHDASTSTQPAPILVLLGPPGSGRGTQARLLSRRLARPRISTGEILREMAGSDTPLGDEIRDAQEEGRYVGDDVIVQIIRSRMQADDAHHGVVFHGYPATKGQADALEAIAREPGNVLALAIVVPYEILFERLSGRRVCPQCDEVYNIYFFPPVIEGFCDHDGVRLVQRGDDAEATVKSRLMAYHHVTAPLFGYYRESGRLVEVDGDRPVEDVYRDLCVALGLRVC